MIRKLFAGDFSLMLAVKWLAAILRPAILLVVLAGCNLPSHGQALAPTLNTTQVFQTVVTRSTTGAARTPSATLPQPPTESGAPTRTVTASPVAPTNTRVPTAILSPTPTKVCHRAAAGSPIDVTIPDDMKLEPGEPFTKIWRLRNVGACTWTADYMVELFSGEAMGAVPRVPLSKVVEPGGSVDISIDMIAPPEPGRHQGNWKLRNEADRLFGIGPDGSAPFWVRIVVVRPEETSPPPSTSTPIPFTPTPTQTLTPTQVTVTPEITVPPPTISSTFTTAPPTATSVAPTPVDSTPVASTSTLTATVGAQAGDPFQLPPAGELDLDLDPVNGGSKGTISYFLELLAGLLP